jgi:hypothetical protein
MCFAQAAGENLELRYVAAHYGPYAENLRHVLKAVDGYMISGYGDGGENPEKPLELVPGAEADARAFLATYPETRARFEKVAALMEGFESSFGTELLATVHWVVTHDGALGLPAIIKAVHGWGPQKAKFAAPQIELAARHLATHGWVDRAMVGAAS